MPKISKFFTVIAVNNGLCPKFLGRIYVYILILDYNGNTGGANFWVIEDFSLASSPMDYDLITIWFIMITTV